VSIPEFFDRGLPSAKKCPGSRTKHMSESNKHLFDKPEDIDFSNPNFTGTVVGSNGNIVAPELLKKFEEDRRTHEFNILNYGQEKSPLTGKEAEDEE
jgi:hypothetical protein